MNMKNKLSFFYHKRVMFLFLLIIFLATFLRIYKLEQVPPSLTWDEAAVGYNAWTIANYGRDEYGKFFPLYFRSFGEDKQPVHVYITAFFVKLFGLSEFITRFPSALFGVFNVILIFCLSRILFKGDFIALFASFFLAISPQNIFFSRFNHEANFALFFFMLGLITFYKALQKRGFFLPLAVLFLFVSMVSYHAAEVIVPPIMILLIILYLEKIRWDKIGIILSIILIIGFVVLGVQNPKLLGTTRFNQTANSIGDIQNTQVYKKTGNQILARVTLNITQYFKQLNPFYLFVFGDKNPRLSTTQFGELYLIDIIFLFLGLRYLIKMKSKERLLLFAWVIIAPLPSSIGAEVPHAGRAMFMMGSWNLVSALGILALINLFNKKILIKMLVIIIILLILFISLGNYLNYYFNKFPKRYAIDWQYGMKQIVEYADMHKEYNQVFITPVRAQPYIFFLYYLKTPLPDYLNTVLSNNSKDQSSNNVSYFGRFSFGGWNGIENAAFKRVLYVLSPSEYDGLRNRSAFDIKKVIYYPNNSTAFFLVTLKE